jgi:hypothetical protein
LDDIEIARRIFGFNLGLNLGGNPLSSKQGIYTSVAGPQRKQIENGCKAMMSGIASLKDASETRIKPSSESSDLSDLPHIALRRWGSFNLFRSDPYLTVMNDCTQVLALIGSPAMDVAGPTKPKPVE